MYTFIHIICQLTLIAIIFDYTLICMIFLSFSQVKSLSDKRLITHKKTDKNKLIIVFINLGYSHN